MRALKILLIIVVFISQIGLSHGTKYSVDPKMEKVFESFVIKLEKKYDNKKELLFLELLNKKIIHISETKKLSNKYKKVFADLLVLSNEKIFEIQEEISQDNFSQQIVESSHIKKLKDTLDKINVASFAKKLESSNRKLIKISDKQEFIENNTIKRLVFTKYFEITSKNSSVFLSMNGYILINTAGESWFVESATIKEKIPYSQAAKHLKGFILKDKAYFKQGNDFFSYNFKNFTYLDDTYGFYLSDLESNGIDASKSILYLSDNKRYNFITKYSEVKLISNNIIFGITDKQKFLEHLVNDKLHLSGDTDYLFEQLQSEVNGLTKNLSQKKKIEKIYGWVLNNVEYTRNLDLNDKKIFSGILTYKNNDGVCEGYAKLHSYALMFAGVPGSDVIRGDVVDAQDFPDIGHAWVKINNNYYDPTFDDPIGAKKTKVFSEYRFFGLPRDLFYANRFDYGVTPEDLKTKSMDYRINFINQRLTKLAEKYKGKDYLLLQGVEFSKNSGLEVGEKITIINAKGLLKYREVTEKKNGELVFSENGREKNITKLQYYVVNDSNISQIFEKFNYEMDRFYLLKWNSLNGKTEYRMGFDVEII